MIVNAPHDSLAPLISTLDSFKGSNIVAQKSQKETKNRERGKVRRGKRNMDNKMDGNGNQN